ncbi:hypothetical protein Daura_11340 [Dactylosporangium aurantiacum]|uniref:Septum formation initiator n=1 Tax=Dactylosporangium aurantiacum TaxID=35754 RepID=A0A9Q9IMV3_9ACTN|nr:hypothetical protein [Dactylosporangium aurantiacum]MDG6104298.1 hypothetical protein [Dactylosporangium aurantiacum]UWZ56707.1 hypothetical protein Daura_11340 [Dactylosporangium aurantiacum]
MATTVVRRWALAGGAWLATVAAATAVATGAVGSMREGIFGTSDTPYSEAEVAALLAGSSAGPTSAASSPQPASTPTSAGPTGVVRALTTPGGTIVAVCEAGLATLRSWTPNTGFEAEHVQRGPAAVASLRFKARSGGGDVRAQVRCVGAEPSLTLGGDD